MSKAGQQLFDQIADGLWSVLDRYRAQAALKLSSLNLDPAFAATVLGQNMLETLHADDIPSADDAVSSLIKGFLTILPDSGPDPKVTLHGFDPGGGQPRGLALAVAGPGSTFVAALTGDGPRALAIEFAVIGNGDLGGTLQLSADWSLVVSGDANAGGRLLYPRDDVPKALDAVAAISVGLMLRYSGPALDLGLENGPHLALTGFSVGLATTIDAAGNPKVSWTISLPQAQLSLVADQVSGLLGDVLAIPVNLTITADAEVGFALNGGGLRVSLPGSVSLPGVDIGSVDLEVSIVGGDVQFGFGLGFTASLPGFPLLTVTASGLGASFPFSTGAARLGLNPPVHPATLTGIGLDLALPVVSGGGFLKSTGPGGYGGVLDLNLLEVSIKAFGLLQLPVPGKLLSFIAIISVEFPFPGIDLSFGFALAGVGGIAGINRRLDRDALNAAIVDGSAAQLLFPVDPAAHAPAIIATMGRVFPEAPDHIVVGPILKVTWGGRIVQMVVAVVVDFPNPLQFVVLGRIVVALPDPLVPQVLVQATFAGTFELSPNPGSTIVASLDGSYLSGMPLSGDIFFLLRGAPDPQFVFSAGGFHPRFVPPQGVPPGLHRIQLSMTPPGVPGLRAEAYLAITTNTVQFGAQLELNDEIAGCGVQGWFGFDTLFKWDPHFSFSIGASAGVAVQVFGKTLMGVDLQLFLEGPTPWHIQGTGSVRLFLFHVSLDFEHKWGPDPAPALLQVDLGEILEKALADPSAWTGSPPSGDTTAVSLSDHARDLIGSGNTVHPLGSVTAQQRAVPFDIMISRFQQQPIEPQTWHISSEGSLVRDFFPPGELIDLTEDQKFSSQAFESWPCGAALTAAGVEHSELPPAWNVAYESKRVPDLASFVGPDLSQVRRDTEFLLAVGNIQSIAALWHPPDLQGVAVSFAQPLTVATTDNMTPRPEFGTPRSFTETFQAAQASFGTLGHAASFQIVESWEAGL